MKKLIRVRILVTGLFLLLSVLFSQCEPIDTRLPDASSLENAPEIYDDADPRAWVASTSIPSANRIYQLFNVQTPCTPSATSQQYFYAEGDTYPYNQPDSVAKLANGYRSWTVKTDRYNVWLKKAWDKTKVYTIFARDKNAKYLVSIAQVKPDHQAFNFLPNYRKEGVLFDCDGSERVPLY